MRRLGTGALVLWFVSFIVFFATQMLPSDPARAILGRTATPELVRALQLKLHLDRPIIEQYWIWFSGVLQGNFGESLASHQPVTTVLAPRIDNSLSLLLMVSVLMVPLAMGMGIALAVRRDSLMDRTVTNTFIATMALPDFVVGTLVLIVLSTSVLQLFPAASLIPPGASPFASPQFVVLPALTLLITTVPFVARLVRGSMIEALDSEYVAMARLRGVPARTVVWRHALPNSLVPALQASAMMMSYLLGGVVVVEYVFNYPGLGRALNDAIAYRDLPLIQAITFIFAAGVVLFNLIADLLTVLLTPKLRTRDAR
ncbi:peptide ABC transporter permease [Mycobacterium sp. AT1]|nr:peptide ABC transporter permease [Mycobacterium sp. AT1]